MAVLLVGEVIRFQCFGHIFLQTDLQALALIFTQGLYSLFEDVKAYALEHYKKRRMKANFPNRSLESSAIIRLIEDQKLEDYLLAPSIPFRSCGKYQT